MTTSSSIAYNMSIKAIKAGMSFGLTSGVITTLGLMIGLAVSTSSKLAVIGGVLTIAIADAFSDALGIHLSNESQHNFTVKEVWISSFVTFLAKFFTAITFIIAVLFFNMPLAIGINIVWGLLILCILSFYLAKSKNEKPFCVISEHILMTLLVIVMSFIVGELIKKYFTY